MKKLFIFLFLVLAISPALAQKTEKRLNFFVSTKSKQFDMAMFSAQWQARLTSMFSKNHYCIVVDSLDVMIRKVTGILKQRNAKLGCIWLDSHGNFNRRYSSFEIGEVEISYRTLKDYKTVSRLKPLAEWVDSASVIAIGSCYGGATFSHAAIEDFGDQRMYGDSLMIYLSNIFNKATVYGSESFVMSGPGMFRSGYSLAGRPGNKKFNDPVFRPVWENLGIWNCYDGKTGSFKQVNTVCMDRQGNVCSKPRTYLSFNSSKKRQQKKLARLKKGKYNLSQFYQSI